VFVVLVVNVAADVEKAIMDAVCMLACITEDFKQSHICKAGEFFQSLGFSSSIRVLS